VDALDQAFKAELNTRITELPQEPLFAQLQKSQAQLEQLNDKLRALVSKKKLSREEMMEKRLIQSWMTFVDQEAKDLNLDKAVAAPPEMPRPSP
jgi:TolA-binding protein